MRALIILCEPRHQAVIQAVVRKHAHALLAPKMTAVIPFDSEAGRPQEGQAALFQALSPARVYQTAKALVVATREVSQRLKLAGLAAGGGFELLEQSASVLTRREERSTSFLHAQINQCDLSVVGGASVILNHWTHGQVGHEQVLAWLEQFQRMGAYGWIGKALLGHLDLMPPADLSQALANLRLDADEVICVNQDPRGNHKSASVLGNVLTKRHVGRKIYSNPAEAIEQHGAKRILLVEDGLWSGKESVGILDSLLGARKPERLKTPSLANPALLGTTAVRLIYVVGTDYGQAIVRRALRDRGLEHVQVECLQTIDVTDPALLAQLGDPSFNTATLFDRGPDAAMLRPHAFTALERHGMSAADLQRLVVFCKHVGHQLWGNYLLHMQQTQQWKAWDAQKHANSATGMHGLGLTHAFGHSVPKASLPLFWGAGPVEIGGKRLTWRPLLPNS